jgi:hypothetical protein
MVILKSVCARVCVCEMGKKGRACENSHGTLPLFELEIKDTTDTIMGPTI